MDYSGYDRTVHMSPQGFNEMINMQDGKNFHWTTDKNVELPIKMSKDTPPELQNPCNILEHFKKTVDKYPERDCLFVMREEKVYTWNFQQYWDDATKFAKALNEVGVQERAGVSMFGFNAPEWTIGCVGAWKANCIVTGLYVTSEPNMILYQVNHAGVECVVTENNVQAKKVLQNAEQMPQLKAVVVYGEKSLPEDVQDSRLYLWNDFLKLSEKSSLTDADLQVKQDKQKPGQCCVLVYTSGTTGMPKGVMITHDNLVYVGITAWDGFYGTSREIYGPHTRLVSHLPLSHIAAFWYDLICQMTIGFEIYFAQPDALAGTLVKTIKWAQPTMFFSVPRVWEKFEIALRGMVAALPPEAYEESKDGEKKLKSATKKSLKEALGLGKATIMFYGAAPLKRASVDFFLTLGIPLNNVYGMSELTGPSVYQPCHRNWFKYDCTGFPLIGTELKIDKPDEKGEGEICWRGRLVMNGYLNNEAATKATFDAQGFLHSGDLGHIDEEGVMVVSGRKKEIIITSGGENVSPIPVEDRFKADCPPCSNMMLIGEGRHFVACIITFKCAMDPKTGGPTHALLPEVTKFFQEKIGKEMTTTDEVCAEPLVNDYIKEIIEKTNHGSISRAAHVRKWLLLTDDFSVPGDELTPTLKLKRSATEAKYMEKINKEIYNM